METPGSGRRSRYIGVSKNGDNWQVLVNMGKFKKYIGTYVDEKEAAVAYDFYTICLHSTKAKTNFAYKKGMILDMINHYTNNSKVFNPKHFACKV